MEDFKKILDLVKDKKCVLPDFQRDFVWTEKEMQINLIASVLSKIPVGSILLLESSSKDFACKVIGTSIKLQDSDLGEESYFLLDGQQRITVLANVFSNTIHKNARQASNLINQKSLKRRFFIEMPQWMDLCDKKCIKKDVFGIEKLLFPIKDQINDVPNFISTEISSYILCEDFNAGDTDLPYNPYRQQIDYDLLSRYCIGKNLIPLFLLLDTDLGKVNLDFILNTIAIAYSNSVCNYLSSLGKDARKKFVGYFLSDKQEGEDVEKAANDFEYFCNLVKNRACIWKQKLLDYLNSCLQKMEIGIIKVEKSGRDRAIDIYENMNKGGVKLGIFDLMTAKVAKCEEMNNINYRSLIIDKIKESKKYKCDLAPEQMQNILKNAIDEDKYNATLFSGCINDDDKISKLYENIFLDVLSLKCNNKDYDYTKYNIELTKRSKILSISSKDIYENTSLTVTSIDRTMFFLHCRCGVKKMSSVNYELIIVVISLIFTNEEWFNDLNVHKILEAWYWSVMFSGRFEKNQNEIMVQSIIDIIKTIKLEQNNDWIKRIKEDTFENKYFSDKDTLLMKRVNEDIVPKAWFRELISQFFLSRPYCDLIKSEGANNDQKISVFYKKWNANARKYEYLELHHIIPLATVSSYSESTSKLRNEKKHILNSPINFAYISHESNNKISDDNIGVYLSKITDESKTSLKLTNMMSKTTDEERLENRLIDIVGEVKARIESLL